MQPPSYRQLLRHEFDVRKARRSAYSLRSFARDLGIASHRLSEILNNKAGLSRARAEVLSRKLWAHRTQRDYFCDLVESEHSRKKEARTSAMARVRDYEIKHGHNHIYPDHFMLISKWHHFAILEYMAAFEKVPSPAAIGKKLGLTKIEVQEALQRLERMGLVRIANDQVEVIKKRNVVPGSPSAESIRHFHLGILDRQREVLQRAEHQTNEFNTTILAIRQDDVEEAKGLIKKFWRDFEHILNKPKKDALYCLSINFFNLEETAKHASKH